jgi:exopolyphosphatase/guanosine-5'-triphosphate,3'-diphosphate pyrophosphatase
MASYGVEDVTIGATSASRDARNQDELIGYIQAETGLRYDILSGEEEALWTFRGAVSAFEGRTGSCIVMDLGGGSTEVVVGRIDDGSLQSRTSLNLGAVRITERFFSALPPSGDDVIQAQQFMNSTFQTLPLARNSALPLIGTSGSTTAKLAALHAGFQSEINRPNDYFSMTADAVQGWSERLLTCTADEVLALNKAAMHGRADVFAAGVLILNTFMQFFGFDAYEVSPRGLRHGLALRWLARKQRTPMDSA